MRFLIFNAKAIIRHQIHIHHYHYQNFKELLNSGEWKNAGYNNIEISEIKIPVLHRSQKDVR